MASFLQSIIVKESTLCLYLMTLMIDSDSKPLKIVVVNSLVAPEFADTAAQEQAERARALCIGLLESGYNILAALPPDADLAEQIARLQPDVIVAIAHFEVDQKLRHEQLAETKLKLAERKVIERAKGLLMEHHHCTEYDVYCKLRRLAMDKNLNYVPVMEDRNIWTKASELV